MPGKKRNLERKIKHLLQYFPVVVILGARQVGKTTLSKNIAPEWRYFDLENIGDRARIESDPVFFFQQYPERIIIDEAQELPELFSVLRGVVDANRQTKGRFILTGSSSPELLNNVSETLAGRVAIVELGTLKANEWLDLPLSEFYEIFNQQLSPEKLPIGNAPISLQQIHEIWFKGGYPEPLLYDDEDMYQNWMQNYYDTYINRDVVKLFPRINRTAYQQFFMMLSQLSGTQVNKREIARAVEVSEKTIKEYLRIAEGTFLWRNLLSYEKNVEKSIVKMPKGYYRDTGLLHYLQKIPNEELLFSHPKVGQSFESFVIEELSKGLSASMVTNWDMCFYRTHGQAEIDLIIDGTFGVLPIEVKRGVMIDKRRLKSLKEFVDQHQLPFGVVVNQSSSVEWLTPKVVQIPVGWL